MRTYFHYLLIKGIFDAKLSFAEIGITDFFLFFIDNFIILIYATLRIT